MISFLFFCCLLFVAVDSVNLNINNIFAVFLFVCGYSWRHEKTKEFFCKKFQFRKWYVKWNEKNPSHIINTIIVLGNCLLSGKSNKKKCRSLNDMDDGYQQQHPISYNGYPFETFFSKTSRTFDLDDDDDSVFNRLCSFNVRSD